MKKSYLAISTLIISFFAILSCEKILPAAPEATDVMDAPIEGLTQAQNRKFLEGAEEFDEVYTRETGLGPIFVASACASCHSGDNKGHLFTTLTRFGQNDTLGNKFLDFGAPQIQHNFIAGHSGEKIPTGATSTKLVAPIVSGTGLLELVSDQDLLAMTDPNDANKDGISGRVNWNTIPNWVNPSKDAISRNGKYICRFGKKASNHNLHQQTVQAFNQDMGITTTFMLQNPFNYLDGTSSIPSADPDITDAALDATIFYIQTLQAPFQRNQDDADIKFGKTVFNKINCNDCHKEQLKTGFSPVTALSNKTFFPYTDLLLHDMGASLDDKYTEGTALTSEWRTAPLWGLGLSEASQGGQYFLMHDGRARSIEAAIEMHAGEALNSKNKYLQLSVSEKEALIKFLKSL